MKIKKEWNCLSDQRSTDKDGNTWLMSSLIYKAKDLKPFDIPLEHLCISSKKIGDTSIRGFVSHMKMVQDADLSYPIILDEDGAIFDGCHRVAKALLEGKESIKAVRFEEDPAPDYKKD